VLDDIHAAVNTGTLAIPHAKHTIIPCALEQIGLLAPPNGRRCQILIQSRLKKDVIFLQPRPGFPHGLVDSAQG